MTVNEYLVSNYYGHGLGRKNMGSEKYNRKFSWYICDVNDRDIKIDRYGDVVIPHSTTRVRSEIIDGFRFVRVTNNTVAEEEIKKLGFERIPEMYLEKEMRI